MLSCSNLSSPQQINQRLHHCQCCTNKSVNLSRHWWTKLQDTWIPPLGAVTLAQAEVGTLPLYGHEARFQTWRCSNPSLIWSLLSFKADHFYLFVPCSSLFFILSDSPCVCKSLVAHIQPINWLLNSYYNIKGFRLIKNQIIPSIFW